MKPFTGILLVLSLFLTGCAATSPTAREAPSDPYYYRYGYYPRYHYGHRYGHGYHSHHRYHFRFHH